MPAAPKTPPGRITATERRQLIALIKLHFKTLRSEIDTEEKRMVADVATKVAAQIREAQAAGDAVRAEMRRIADEANKALDLLIANHPELFMASQGGKWSRPSGFSVPHLYRRNEDEESMRRAILSEIRARASEARMKISRDEVERLRELHIEALQTQAALALAGTLPKIGDLLPPGDVLQLEEVAA